MRDRDAEEFGAIVDALVGDRCERSLATNSIKLRFGADQDPRGGRYIWIDPPWTFWEGDREITSSFAYDAARFHAWSEVFQPLDSTVLEAWEEDGAGGSVFVFAHGYRLVVPRKHEPVSEDAWYVHWYAAESFRGLRRDGWRQLI
jgi:hypothetical protein